MKSTDVPDAKNQDAITRLNVAFGRFYFKSSA
jgi:hypothetical protein